MRRSTPFVVALLFATMPCLWAHGQPAGDLRPPARVAVVDLTRVFSQSTRRQALEEALRERQGELARQENARLEAIQRLSGEIESYAMGTPERTKLERERKAAAGELETWRRESFAEMNEKFTGLLSVLYNEACRDAAAAASERGFDMVIKDQSSERAPETRDEAAMMFSQRIVIYAKPEYDLTDEVVQRMNARYAAELEKGVEPSSEDAAAPQPK